MRTIQLTDHYAIPVLINGGWQLSAGHASASPDGDDLNQTMFAMLRAGLNTFDCADIYTGVEEALGRFRKAWMQAGQPDGPLQIHTKFVPNMDDLAKLKHNDVARIVERSLKRLGVERLDLVQFHWWDYEVPGYVEAVQHLQRLQQEGKIRYIGLTNFDTPRMKEILEAGVPIVSHQVQYSLLDRRPQNGMAALCADNQAKLLCYGSLSGGFLTKKYLGLAEAPKPENRSLIKYALIIEEFGSWDAYQHLLKTLEKVAHRHDCSIANIASAWALRQEAVGAVIVGFRNDAHIHNNLQTAAISLTDEDLQEIGDVLERHAGPDGDTFSLEREPGGPHSVIMKTNLN